MLYPQRLATYLRKGEKGVMRRTVICPEHLLGLEGPNAHYTVCSGSLHWPHQNGHANRHGPRDPRLQRSLIPHDLAFLLAPGSPSSPGFHFTRPLIAAGLEALDANSCSPSRKGGFLTWDSTIHSTALSTDGETAG